MNYLNDTDRSQALAWYAVFGFSLKTLSDYYGLTINQMSKELQIERERREKAGKSSQPIPVVGKSKHGLILITATKALQAIVRTQSKYRDQAYANKIAVRIAESALKEMGFLPANREKEK